MAFQERSEQETESEVGKRSPGRKGSKDAPPAVVDVTKLKKFMPELKKLLNAKEKATVEYNEAVTKAAEKADLLSNVVNKAVKAYAGDDFEEKHREVEQLGLVFDEVAKLV